MPSGHASNGPDTRNPPISNEELQILATHISPSVAAEFTTDGKWIVVGGTDGLTIHNSVSTRAVNWFNAGN